MSARLPFWRLQADLLAARLLLAVAPAAASRLSAEDHGFLAVRHGQLAACWRAIGWTARAAAHERAAAYHWESSDGDEPPPAVAVGLMVPRPTRFVDARGGSAGRGAPVLPFPSRTPR